MGGVLSHNPALARLDQLIVPLAFHVACMVLGTMCMTARRPAQTAAPVERV